MNEQQLAFIQNRKIEVKICVLVLLVVGTVAFFPSLSNRSTNWDDNAQIFANPVVRELSCLNLVRIFRSRVISEYHPLVTALFAVEYRIFGLNPGPYHVHSLIFHLANGLLVFFLFLRLTDNIPAALGGALLFVAHPLHAQPVSWISARKDLVYSFFYLLALITFFRYHDSDRRVYYYLSFAFFICSALSKTLAVTLPAVLVLWICLYRGRLNVRDWLRLTPFLAVSLMVGLLALEMQTVRYPGSAAHLGFSSENVLLLIRNLAFYVTRVVFPADLSPIYLFPQQITFWSSPTLAALFLLASLVCLVCRARNVNIFWGVGFFLITLLPVVRFIPFTGIEVAANRFAYLPSVGLCYLAGLGLSYIFPRLIARKTGGVVIVFALTLLVLLLVVNTRMRCRIWKDNETLWSEAIRKQGASDLLYHMLADSRFREGRFREAAELCDTAIKINPAMTYSYILKERAQTALGQLEEAAETREQYKTVLKRLGIGR